MDKQPVNSPNLHNIYVTDYTDPHNTPVAEKLEKKKTNYKTTEPSQAKLR